MCVYTVYTHVLRLTLTLSHLNIYPYIYASSSPAG